MIPRSPSGRSMKSMQGDLAINFADFTDNFFSVTARNAKNQMLAMLWLLATVISIKCSKLKIVNSCALLKWVMTPKVHLVNPCLPKTFDVNDYYKDARK